jgi:hypothetical protein
VWAGMEGGWGDLLAADHVEDVVGDRVGVTGRIVAVPVDGFGAFFDFGHYEVVHSCFVGDVALLVSVMAARMVGRAEYVGCVWILGKLAADYQKLCAFDYGAG